MKTSQIKNALIKNKPNYNYLLFDLDNVLVAKGHLINSKQKLQILKHMKYDINLNGEIKYDITSMIDFYALWIIQSLDWWIFELLPITKLSIYLIDFEVVKWLSDLIQSQITKSLLLVDLNEKN